MHTSSTSGRRRRCQPPAPVAPCAASSNGRLPCLDPAPRRSRRHRVAPEPRAGGCGPHSPGLPARPHPARRASFPSSSMSPATPARSGRRCGDTPSTTSTILPEHGAWPCRSSHPAVAASRLRSSHPSCDRAAHHRAPAEDGTAPSSSGANFHRTCRAPSSRPGGGRAPTPHAGGHGAERGIAASAGRCWSREDAAPRRAPASPRLAASTTMKTGCAEMARTPPSPPPPTTGPGSGPRGRPSWTEQAFWPPVTIWRERSGPAAVPRSRPRDGNHPGGQPVSTPPPTTAEESITRTHEAGQPGSGASSVLQRMERAGAPRTAWPGIAGMNGNMAGVAQQEVPQAARGARRPREPRAAGRPGCWSTQQRFRASSVCPRTGASAIQRKRPTAPTSSPASASIRGPRRSRKRSASSIQQPGHLAPRSGDIQLVLERLGGEGHRLRRRRQSRAPEVDEVRGQRRCGTYAGCRVFLR